MSTESAGSRSGQQAPGGHRVLGVVAWLWVGLPFLYGLIQLIAKIPALFSV